MRYDNVCNRWYDIFVRKEHCLKHMRTCTRFFLYSTPIYNRAECSIWHLLKNVCTYYKWHDSLVVKKTVCLNKSSPTFKRNGYSKTNQFSLIPFVWPYLILFEKHTPFHCHDVNTSTYNINIRYRQCLLFTDWKGDHVLHFLQIKT